jgi:hypothetical protein
MQEVVLLLARSSETLRLAGVVNIPFSIGCVLCIHKTDRFCIEISPELTIFDTIK